MTKDIIRNEDDVSNTLYAIGRCDEDIFDVPYIGDDVTIEYKIRDTELWVRQIVVEEIDGKDVLVENPKDAMIDITGELEDENKDIRNLYFTSNEDYEKYTSYYHEVEYVAMPVVPSDYELVKMDIRDEEMKNPMNLDSYNIDGSSGTFEYEYSDENDDISYVKYLTVYMRKKSNNNWHNDDAILNEFNPIEINL